MDAYADSEAGPGPVIEVPVSELRRLLAQAEVDVTAFLHRATLWTARQLPGRSEEVSGAIRRALTLQGSAMPPRP